MTAEPPSAFDALQEDRERSSVETPRGNWIMGQSWEDLLFLSWPVPVAALRHTLEPCHSLAAAA